MITKIDDVVLFSKIFLILLQLLVDKGINLTNSIRDGTEVVISDHGLFKDGYASLSIQTGKKS